MRITTFNPNTFRKKEGEKTENENDVSVFSHENLNQYHDTVIEDSGCFTFTEIIQLKY